jgi:PspA-Associated protein
VIVRISGEGQYRLDESDHGKLDELDNAVVAAVDAGDEDAFHEAFEELLAFVRSGEQLADDDLSVSDHILPPSDLTFPEAGEEFSGDGLIPEPS